MLKVRKNIIYTALISIIMAMTALFAFMPTTTTGNVYAYDMDKRLSLQSEMINNVILFAFNEDANLVINNGTYTARTYDFIEQFDDRLNNAENSLQKYYHAMSNGKFKIKSNLVMNDNGTPNNTSDDTPFVVILDVNKTDCKDEIENAQQNAINAILSEFSNTSTTAILGSNADSNADGYVDILTFICLDFDTEDNMNGQSQSVANTFMKNEYRGNMCWPHRTSYSCGGLNFSAGSSSYTINQYLVMPSVQFTANTTSPSFNNYLKSTFFHELGHGLGLPDMYVVDNNSLEYVGLFDIMSSNYMQSMSTYTKSMLGWTTTKEFKEITMEGTYTLAPSNTNEVNTKNGNPINDFVTLSYYITDPAYPNQKIVLEYRDLTNTSSFDNNVNRLKFTGDLDCLSSGLTIYRINETYNDKATLIIDSNYDNKASVFYFRNNDNLTDRSGFTFTAGDIFGKNEGVENQSSQSDINTKYIAFTQRNDSQTSYINSNLRVEVISMNSTGLTFKVTGGSLETNTEDETMAKNILLDSKLLTALSDLTGIPESDLTVNDLEGLVELNLSNKGITDLTGLSRFYMPALKTLILNNNQITNGLEEISIFSSITNLQMSDCGLTDISFIIPLTNLAYVNFSINKISDFVCLNPKVKTKLIFANLVLNNLDTTLESNNFILSGSYSETFAVGIQNFPLQPTNIQPRTIYYNSLGLPSSLILTLSNNSVVCNLEDGQNILGDGHYTLTYKFNDPSIAQEINKTIVIDIIVVTLKQPIVELLIGDIYQNDSTASFDGWKSSYSYKASITFNNQTVEYVDTSVAGTYSISFEITVNANTKFTLYKQVIVYNDVRIAFGEDGIKDKKLYIELLKLVGKQATIVNNEETVGTNADNTLYSQDLYFYDIDGKGDEITELNFANKKITDLTGISLVNLKKIVVINLNQNSIIDISPLFEQGNEAMPNLQELHLASLGLTQIPATMGQMYSLKKIDLSFNKLTEVSALKPLVIPALLENAGKEQMLQLVNLNMNNISFSESGAYVEDENGEMKFVQDANYAILNNFTKDTTEIAGYKSGDQIFILMIQNMQNYMSYINQPTFDYYNTRANTQIRKGKTEYIFIIKVNTLNVMDAWSNQSPKEYCKTSAKYNVTFSINGTNPFKLSVTNTQFKRCFFVSTVTLKNLKDINKKEFTLEDQWNYEENRYHITSTERIANPSQSDLNIVTPIRNAEYHLEFTAFYLETIQGETKATFVNFDKDSDYNLKTYTYEITITCVVSIGGTEDGVSIKCHENATLKYYVQIHINDVITINDSNLDAKMREILKKKDGDKLYAYDTYNLTTLNLSNSQISSINNISGGRDFTSFHFDNLLSLNLSKNNLTHINLNSINFKKLSYIDLSFNSLCDATELKNIHSQAKPIYVLVSNNLYNFNSDNLQYGQYAKGNMWLITADAKYADIQVIVGIQGINSTTASFVTYTKDITSVEGSTAGFYYIPATIFDAKGFNATGATNDVNPDIANYHYNYFYYYKEAGTFTISFNFNFKNFSFNYQGTVNHGKAYVDDSKKVYIIDYSKINNEEAINTAISFDCLIYENCSTIDFTKDYTIFLDDNIIDISDIVTNKLLTYRQAITITHNITGNLFYYTKTINVLDREAPIISMDESSKYVQTKINTPYNWYSRGGIDRDISATDNCDKPQDILFKAIIYKDGDDTPLDSEYVPLDKPGIYTITFTAIDKSGNESEPVVRKVRVHYLDYTIVKVSKPSALLYTGDSTFSVTVYRIENRDPNPTFYWYVDGQFIATSTIDADSVDSKVAITSTVNLPFKTAGKHIVTVKINEFESEDFVVVAQSSEVEYFVLLDSLVTNLLVYIAVGIVTVAIVTYIITRIIRKKKERKLADYEYNLISKK